MLVQVNFIMGYMRVHMHGQSLVGKIYVSYMVMYINYNLQFVDSITCMEIIK